MSYAAEVIADNSGKFCGNGCRFATRPEAEAYARDLSCRWTAVREWRVVESTDPVNYQFGPGGAERLPEEEIFFLATPKGPTESGLVVEQWRAEFSEDFAVPHEIDALIHAGELADMSWHNDVSPSFALEAHLLISESPRRLWVHHPDPAQREAEGARRFVVCEPSDDMNALYEGDDLQAALAALRADL